MALEFEGRHNARPLDTIDLLRALTGGMTGKWLRSADLVS